MNPLLVGLVVVLLTALGFWILESHRSFTDSFHIAVQTLATVGYGDIPPVTVAGKLFMMVSSLFGMALFGLALSEVNRFLSFGQAVTLLCVLFFTSTLLVSVVEGMWWFDALYMCFVTATTVGYGDVTVKTATGKWTMMLFTVVCVAPMARVLNSVGTAWGRVTNGSGGGEGEEKKEV